MTPPSGLGLQVLSWLPQPAVRFLNPLLPTPWSLAIHGPHPGSSSTDLCLTLPSIHPPPPCPSNTPENSMSQPGFSISARQAHESASWVPPRHWDVQRPPQTGLTLYTLPVRCWARCTYPSVNSSPSYKRTRTPVSTQQGRHLTPPWVWAGSSGRWWP